LNTTPVTAKLLIKVLSHGSDGSGGSSALVISAKSAAITATANASFKVNRG